MDSQSSNKHANRNNGLRIQKTLTQRAKQGTTMESKASSKPSYTFETKTTDLHASIRRIFCSILVLYNFGLGIYKTKIQQNIYDPRTYAHV